MTEQLSAAPRLVRPSLTAVLLLVSAGARAQNLPTLAAPAAPVAAPAPAPAPDGKDANDGFLATIMSTTQGNFGKLGIGVGYIGGGPYLDEKGARRDGLHAGLSISVQGQPKLFQQPDVREGQTLVVADYRIVVVKLLAAPGSKGTVVLRLWAPPKPKADAGWLGRFGL